MSTVVAVLYLIASGLFILGLKMLTKVDTARKGNFVSSFAMLLAVLTTLLDMGVVDYGWILAGLVVGSALGWSMATRVQMTEMPEMVALLNGMGGGASTLVATSQMLHDMKGHPGNIADAVGFDTALTIFISVLIGTVTLTGSLIAFGKLNGKVSGMPILFPGNQAVNLVLGLAIIGLTIFAMATPDSTLALWALLAVTLLSGILGVLLVIPIGGADMPVVISLLNSYSGIAASATGFVIDNNLLIIAGALVGASGIILTQIMCKAMNRSLTNVLFGGFGQEAAVSGTGSKSGYDNVKSCGVEEAAMIFDGARDVIIVPGYGLAVAQAQHATKELADLLQKRGATVRYAIHPVAGRMPGHMNVLLAESNVPYEQLFELDQINEDFQNADIALVLGANDVVNPAAAKDPKSPIYGMPVLKVWEARTVFVVKRSLGAGFAAIPNDLFNYNNNMMIYGDAKKILNELNHELKEMAK